jgi:transglutaminase-like putative cysteine protease
MKYAIQHTTEYTYQEPVSVCHNRLCLAPITTHGQKCLSFEVKISPVPDEMTNRVDFFGNDLLFFSTYKEHIHLKIISSSEVILESRVNSALASVSAIGWEEVKHLLSVNAGINYEVMAYTLPSQHIPASEMVKIFAQDCFTNGSTLWDASNRIMRKIHASFEFKPGFTTINTPVEYVLKAKKGVCQDFAHVMIACFRNLGLPARYVSGYIETIPPLGKEKLVGSDASHAWVSVYFPNIGWVEFDPTNNLHPTDKHITIAVGRDYQDVAPIKGIIFSSGNQTLDVKVDVKRLAV